MDSDKYLVGEGEVELLLESSAIPKNGLNSTTHRVELYEKSAPNESWLSELIVIDDNLPWYAGEKRRVKIRINSTEFINYVKKKRPQLMVRHGSNIIGKLILINLVP